MYHGDLVPFHYGQALILTLDHYPGSTEIIVSMVIFKTRKRHTAPALEPVGFHGPFLCKCLPFTAILSSRGVVERALAETDKGTRGALTAPARSKYLMMET